MCTGDVLTCWDAIAVGGGPAGSAFAIELARGGKRVLVIERTAEAHHKVCGDFLSSDSIELLAYLGLDVFALGAVAIDRFSLISGDTSACCPLPFPAAAFSRRQMDPALLAAATSLGVEVVRGETARGLSSTPDGVCIRTGKRSYRCRDAAVASGKHRIPGVYRPSSRIVGFKMLLDLEPRWHGRLGGQVMLSTYERGYQGLQLLEDGRASVCWIVDRDIAKSLGRDWSDHAAFLSAASNRIGRILIGSRPVLSHPVAIAGLPFGFLRQGAVAERIYTVGDQLATIPSFAGDGIAIALGTGILAARSVLDHENPAWFHDKMKSRLARQFVLARPAHRLMTYPPVQKAGIGILRCFPGLTAKLAAATRFEAASVVLG